MGLCIQLSHMQARKRTRNEVKAQLFDSIHCVLVRAGAVAALAACAIDLPLERVLPQEFRPLFKSIVDQARPQQVSSIWALLFAPCNARRGTPCMCPGLLFADEIEAGLTLLRRSLRFLWDSRA